jgi:hypothetical protein
MSKKPRCQATTRDGKPCGATPMHGKKKCLFHTSNFASELGRKGGRRRAVYNPDGLEPFPPPKNAEELLALLATTICEIRSGRIDPRVANSLIYGSAAFLNTLEIADLGQKLKELEKHFAETKS